MFPDAGPTARALLTLEMLQSRGLVTAEQLAERLGVSERAARRCVQTLRDVGLPVESVRGPHGGFRLGRGLRLPPLVFSATEALGLVMAVLDGHHAAADVDQPVGAALGKLIDALPTTVGRQAALMREHAAAAPEPGEIRPDPQATADLVGAVAEQRQVSITYATEQRCWSEIVDPWAIVVRRARWYLLCHSHRADAVRTYRVDRISKVRQTGEPATVPPGLDPVAELERHLGLGWAYETRVRFDAPEAAVRPWIRPHMGTLAPDPADASRCLLIGSTENAEAYVAEMLTPVPYQFHVEGGPELIAGARVVAARLRHAVSPEA